MTKAMKTTTKMMTTSTSRSTTTTTTTTKAKIAPTVKGKPYVKLGDKIQLACLAEDETQWYHNGKLLETTTQVYEKLATYDDIGNYTCISGSLTSESFTLSIGKEPIVFFDVQSEVVRLYPDSDPFNLTCVTKMHQQDVEYNAEDVGEIKQWFVISNNQTNKEKTIHDSSIILTPPSKENVIYTVTCYAESIFGKSSEVIRYKQRPFFISDIEITNGGNEAPPKLILGDQRLLTCSVNGHPLPKIEWQREAAGSVLPFEKERTVASNNGTLSIYEIQPLDSGVYICTASNQAGKLTKRITVNIVEAPSLSLPPQPSPFSKNQNVRVNCAPSTGSPPFKFEWNIEPDLNVNYTIDMFDTNSVLEIKQLSDSMNVTCLAMNEAGETSSTVQLLVGDEITIEPVYGPIVNEGERLELYCRSSFPVQWIVNGRLMPKDESINIANNTLIIENIQRFHAGLFECTNGKSYSRIEVDVVRAPIVTIKYPGKLVKPGIAITMSCHASGNPTPEVQFYKSDQLKPNSPQSNTIVIENMDSENEGEYTCQAVNAIGSVSETVKISIKSPWINPSYQEVFSGETTQMSCFSTTENIVWRGPITNTDTDAPIIESNERFNLTSQVLTIQKTFITDSGRYSCTNKDDGKSHEAMLHVKSLPARFTHTPLSMAKVAIPSSWYNSAEIQFKFRTDDANNGTLFYVGGSNNVDFFKIELDNAKLVIEWNLGSGTGRIEGGPIVINKWYYVLVQRNEKQVTLSINGNQQSGGQSPGAFTGFDYKPFGVIGGGEIGQAAFFGCLLDMYLNGNMVDFGMLESIGLSTCKIK